MSKGKRDIPYLATCGLFYFTTDEIQIEVNPNLRVRPVSKVEKYKEGWGLIGRGSLHFVAECFGLEPYEEIKKLVTCLLMFKLDSEHSKELPTIGLEKFSWDAGPDNLPPLPRKEDLEICKLLDREGLYHLDIGESDSFIRFWSELTKNDWHPNLKAAARRLIMAQSRSAEGIYEDRLIDMVIAFDTLVLRKKEHGKGDKASKRMARLQQLERGLEGRATEEIKLAYDLRNDAVHDGYFSEKNTRKAGFMDMFLRFIERYLRVGMHNYILLMNQGLSKNEIINRL